MAKEVVKRRRKRRGELTAEEFHLACLLRGQRLLLRAIRHLRGQPAWEDVPVDDRPHNSTAIMDCMVRLSDIRSELLGYAR